ncbi:MuF-like minor capsid protein [Microbacterium phage Teamocil]|uniref:MuF-like minor capsid protein n=1 Tax=Microbacterium phage Teamocil TaxID=2656554 RepID=A0A649VXM9_9CAUD|nr:MuF-like minor capsid protein [Microbacterium phage Teamocil]QGJ88877.1 MuF-like minor capsid protein [Microbacterium phage Gina]QGJ96974.1 MuF-like minor capsid protein [Microbacterium phage Teamocil]
MADLNVTSPAAAFSRQARMEAQVESALRWALREFLADVETMARRDRTYMSAGSVAQAWSDRMGVEALSTRLPEDVARYVSEVQALADTPNTAYDTAMAVLTASSERSWSAQLTSDVLSTALSADRPMLSLTAAAPRATSRRGKAAREAFDAAFGAQGGMSWYDVAKRDARTAVTGLDGMLSTQAMRRQGFGYKQWVARHDERTRHTHAAADGQRVPIDQTFTVGGASLDHPGDRRGPIGEVINCRCVTIGADSPAQGSTALRFISP